MQHNTNLPAVITADDITVDDLAGDDLAGDDLAGDDLAGAARSSLELPPGLLRPLRVMVRWLPVAAIALGIAAFFGFGLDQYVTFEALRDNRFVLADFVHRHAVLAVLLFIALYAAAVALSLPGAVVLTVAGGFLFGTAAGTAYVVTGATAGAVAVFLIARSTLGAALRAKVGPAIRRMEAGFRENALSYLLVLRLVPLFPFFIVNIVPAFLGVPLRTYTIGTLIGIMPGTFVFASVGAGLGSVFDRAERFSPASVLTPEIMVALIGLAALSALPIAYKAIRSRTNRSRRA